MTDSNYSVEEHIYEEIAEEESDSEDTDTDDSDVENSFFTLISKRRRNNLRYYGYTSWDFGT